MNDEVSRGTSASGRVPTPLPPAPPWARGVFPSEQMQLLERYAEWLAGEGTVRGLIGPREVPRLWERHVLNCAALADQVPPGATVCDIGSGAGLPGVVLAIVRPDLQITLVEPLLRRTTFLDEVVADLDLPRLEVVRGRAEALHGERSFDVVTSRAVAPLPRLLDWSMPLVAPGGVLVALKGASALDEVAEAGTELARHGCGAPDVIAIGREPGHDGVDAVQTYALRVSRSDPTALPWVAPSRATGSGKGSGRKGDKRAGRRRRGGSGGEGRGQ